MGEWISHAPTNPPTSVLKRQMRSNTMNTITIENSPHFREWVEELRTTKAPQVRSTLVNGTVESPGFCCLGIGARCAGIPLVKHNGSLYFEYTDDDEPNYADAMPPLKFHEWLGITVAGSDLTADVDIDWPDTEHFTNREEEDGGVPYVLDEDLASASALNDRVSLTFAQIADVLAYFGVRRNQ